MKMSALLNFSYPRTRSPGAVNSYGRFSSTHSWTSPGSASIFMRTSRAPEGSSLLNIAVISSYISLRFSLLERPSAISSVTSVCPSARDSRFLTAARISPLALDAISSIAAGSTSTPSFSAMA